MNWILEALLDKLRERGSYCPYCSGEYVHTDESCVLYGLWFNRELEQNNEKDE